VKHLSARLAQIAVLASHAASDYEVNNMQTCCDFEIWKKKCRPKTTYVQL